MSRDLAEIFTRRIKAGGITATPVRHRIEANTQERTALAAIFGLPGIAQLSGDFSLVQAPGHGRGGVIEATLALRARVTPTCVVSLEPFEAKITETATLNFVPAAGFREDAEIAMLDPESLEGPDEVPYAGESIDLGAALAEQLALALDPYPRKPGASLPVDLGQTAVHPFAGLANHRLRPPISGGNEPANDDE